MSSSILADALTYAALGWSIIPIRPNSKKAAVKWKQFQDGAADERQIRQWFDDHDYGIAVVPGSASGGLACRDFDVADSYQRWSDNHPDWANTLPTVVTARGRHVYFRTDVADLVFEEFDDGEYRGDSLHYCLLPPSVHPSGAEYRWQVPLPDSPIPHVHDVRGAGLLVPTSCYTENTDYTSNKESVCTVSSASTVSSVYQGDDERIEEMIRACLPTCPGRRNRQVFELARAIKAMPDLADADPDDLQYIVKRWHASALPYIETKPFVETWIDFIQAWPKVKIPKGATMAAIMQKALESPMPPAAMRYEDEPIRWLVALCYQLGGGRAGGRFFLSCRTAGVLLGVSHIQANRWLLLLNHDGVVKQLNKGDCARRQAAEYQYLGD